MCGRFYLDVARDKLEKHYQLNTVPDLLARHNIAQSQEIAAVRESEGGRGLVMLHWGLIPSWAKDRKAHYSMINTRTETVADKPAYRSAFRYSRCLVPVKWVSTGNEKQPYVIRMKDAEVLSLAGVWEHWQNPTGQVIESCSTIVTDANETIRPIHDRMLVIVNKSDYSTWLNPDSQQPADLKALLVPYSLDNLYVYPVSKRVNNPKNDDPACIEAVEST